MGLGKPTSFVQQYPAAIDSRYFANQKIIQIATGQYHVLALSENGIITVIEIPVYCAIITCLTLHSFPLLGAVFAWGKNSGG